ncbi:hypothetical protein [Vibrio phage CKB-S1]|nr:hypothetical protein [Vibrio phage CKB-S1]
MASCPHTHFRRGTTVLVILKDSTKRVCKFKESRSKHIVLWDGEKLPHKLIRQVLIYRRKGGQA